MPTAAGAEIHSPAMPTIEENREQWNQYGWEQQGHEWSATWGGSDYLWWGTLFPRIVRFLPCQRGLEIAPGYGRITGYLLHYCRQLTVVDLTERCIEACRERFAEVDHLEYHVNDGRSLAMVADGSVDFAFSFDSLVHADADVLESYVHELARVLAPTGFAFLHHSNLGAFRDRDTGALPFVNQHWRSETMSAELMRAYCEDAGAACIGQEIVNWGGEALHDCFSLLVRGDSPHRRPLEVRENPGFMGEAENLGKIAHYYRR